MQELKIIEDWEFGRIRVVIIDGEPWFVGKDVAEALGYISAKDAIREHVDNEDRQIIQKSQIGTFETDSNERPIIQKGQNNAFEVGSNERAVCQRSRNTTFEIPNRGLTVINESGLYSLIMGSRLKDAKRFKRWITSEVLPSIRKTGSYMSVQTQGQLTEQIRKQVEDTLVQTIPVIVSETVKQLVPVLTGHTGRMEQSELLGHGKRNRTRVVSKVDYLPPEVKRQVICMLLDPRIRYEDIVVYTEEHGNRVSKSALCRYGKRLERETGGYEVELNRER